MSVKVGLALGSGSAFGLAQVGVLKVLEQERIPIDMVAGVSIGALIAALWATGKNAVAIEEIMMAYNKDKRKVFRLLGDFCFPKRSLINGQRVRKFLKKQFGKRTFAETRLPLRLVACNLGTHEKIVYSSGKIADAVYCSMAIPGMFRPETLCSDLVVDGGILEPVPTHTLISAGAEKIIAVNVLPSPSDLKQGYKIFKEALEKKSRAIQTRNLMARMIYHGRLTLRKLFFPNIFDILVNTILTMEYRISQANCKKADIVLHPVIAGANWFEFFRVEELIRKGEEVARKNIANIKKCIGQ